MRGIALDHVHQIGHQIGAALVLVEHFGPTGLDLFIRGLQRVVAAAVQSK